MPTPKQLERIGQELLDDPAANVNHAATLLAILVVNGHQQEAVLVAIQALKLFFLDACSRGEISGKRMKTSSIGGEEVPAEQVYQDWLARQYATYQSHLFKLLRSEQPELIQVSAFAAAMEGVRGKRPGSFANELFSALLRAALASDAASGAVVGLLLNKYLANADVRYHTLVTLRHLAEDSASALRRAPQGGAPGPAGSLSAAREDAHDLMRTQLDLLLRVAPAAGSKEEWEAKDEIQSWCGAAEANTVKAAASGETPRQRHKRQRTAVSGENVSTAESVKWMSWGSQKRAFQDAWLAFLALPLPADAYKRVLVRLHDLVIPQLGNPLLLCDFLTASLDQGGLVGMLALNGIFILVTKHGLEYPMFYQRLYSLLSAQSFQAKQRVRFFQLADVFLASGLVPAYTAAAFIKKFARLALTSSPAGAAISIAFIHNLLRRHPACNVLLNRLPATDSAADPLAPPPGRSGGEGAAVAADDGGLAEEGGAPSQSGVAGGTPSCSEDEEDGAAIVGAAGQMNGHAHDAANGHASIPPQSDASNAEQAATAAAAPIGGASAEQDTPVTNAAGIGEDVFLEDESDPAKSRALESSLWEISSLRNHYCPQVAAFATVLDKDLTDRRKTSEVDIAPLLTDSYAAMVTAELKRRLKQAPVAFWARPPSTLFLPEAAVDFPGWEFS